MQKQIIVGFVGLASKTVQNTILLVFTLGCYLYVLGSSRTPRLASCHAIIRETKIHHLCLCVKLMETITHIRSRDRALRFVTRRRQNQAAMCDCAYMYRQPVRLTFLDFEAHFGRVWVTQKHKHLCQTNHTEYK